MTTAKLKVNLQKPGLTLKFQCLSMVPSLEASESLSDIFFPGPVTHRCSNSPSLVQAEKMCATNTDRQTSVTGEGTPCWRCLHLESTWSSRRRGGTEKSKGANDQAQPIKIAGYPFIQETALQMTFHSAKSGLNFQNRLPILKKKEKNVFRVLKAVSRNRSKIF